MGGRRHDISLEGVMGRQISSLRDLFRPLQLGDFIKSDEGTWVTRTCPNCLGSGLESNGYVISYKCPTCNGMKYIWVEVRNVTTESDG